MAESFAWPEGTVSLWTGNASPSTSALIAYAKDTQGTFVWGYDNRANASGVYRNHLTGYRADVTFNAIMTVDNTLAKIAQSATAVHMKLANINAIGSAGYFLYSGQIASIRYVGNEKAPYSYQMTTFFNSWSAY